MPKWACERCRKPSISKVFVRRGSSRYFRYTHYVIGTGKVSYCYVLPNSFGLKWVYQFSKEFGLVGEIALVGRDPAAAEYLFQRLKREGGSFVEDGYIYRTTERFDQIYRFENNEWNKKDLETYEKRMRRLRMHEGQQWAKYHPIVPITRYPLAILQPKT